MQIPGSFFSLYQAVGAFTQDSDRSLTEASFRPLSAAVLVLTVTHSTPGPNFNWVNLNPACVENSIRL